MTLVFILFFLSGPPMSAPIQMQDLSALEKYDEVDPLPVFKNGRMYDDFSFNFPLLGFDYVVTTRFSRGHDGVDYACVVGTKVLASQTGQVIRAGWVNGYGWLIDIVHRDGFVTRYAHLSKVFVEVGDHVLTAQVIAKTGSSGHSTGPHLHFEIRTKYNVPLDPAPQVHESWRF